MRKLFCFKKFKFLGFTMAEAILVMTILGIIATIMITTMKPAQFKEKGYEVLAKQTLADLDTALGMVLTNHCPYNSLDACYRLNTTTIYNACTDYPIYTAKLLKNYMATSREVAKDWNGYYRNGYPSSTPADAVGDIFKLKNGVVVDVTLDSTYELETWIPGEKEATTVDFSDPIFCGRFDIDINGQDEPNTLGKDRYRIPFNIYGIVGGD